MSAWTDYWSNCTSRLSAICRCCFLSREGWRQRYQTVSASLDKERAASKQLQGLVANLEQANQQLRARIAELEDGRELSQAGSSSLKLLLGRPAPGQTYPVGLVTLSVNLAEAIGLRPTVRVLQVVFDWLHVSCPIPRYQTIRTWMQRIGLDRMQQAKKVDDGIWLVDHTNQIGAERALTILRVRASSLPPAGTPLRHQDVEVLLCQPGVAWKRDNVEQAYRQVAAQKGHPIAIVSDGAVELREPVEKLKKQGRSPLVIGDLKHLLSNQLEALLVNDPQFQDFTRQASQTRSAVQQTELAHFTAPSLKQKSRFMNLKPMLEWASMVLWHLRHPNSKAREGITPARMNDKLGWLRGFTKPMRKWRECQYVVSEMLKFFNKNGVYRGSATKFRRKIACKLRHTCSKKLLDATLKYVRKTERELKPKQRLPISTEILESSFALYKQLERQHSKGGFTSLLPVFGTLLSPTASDEVQESFARVKVDDVRNWIATNLPHTLASRRQTAYCEARPKKKKKGATRKALAA